ncbi:hypothetical protein [Streptomyces sp. AM 2-1-1]|uniref:hypothetical protein n=1 Tax=Streptomyces sp. AM 2-1-1 TaxID=3028709 RepID=UPI0023BA01FC|nr:hypothetical protein [Streptomyces sp. AM 2-1-1]WEH41292.1 hypothetical protein PZB77_18300 [Streptomyces sp. AM 2-1-1]
MAVTGDIRVLLPAHDAADLAGEAATGPWSTAAGSSTTAPPPRCLPALTPTPPGTVAGRAAEGAYTAPLRDSGARA